MRADQSRPAEAHDAGSMQPKADDADASADGDALPARASLSEEGGDQPSPAADHDVDDEPTAEDGVSELKGEVARLMDVVKAARADAERSRAAAESEAALRMQTTAQLEQRAKSALDLADEARSLADRLRESQAENRVLADTVARHKEHAEWFAGRSEELSKVGEMREAMRRAEARADDADGLSRQLRERMAALEARSAKARDKAALKAVAAAEAGWAQERVALTQEAASLRARLGDQALQAMQAARAAEYVELRRQAKSGRAEAAEAITHAEMAVMEAADAAAKEHRAITAAGTLSGRMSDRRHLLQAFGGMKGLIGASRDRKTASSLVVRFLRRRASSRVPRAWRVWHAAVLEARSSEATELAEQWEAWGLAEERARDVQAERLAAVAFERRATDRAFHAWNRICQATKRARRTKQREAMVKYFCTWRMQVGIKRQALVKLETVHRTMVARRLRVALVRLRLNCAASPCPRQLGDGQDVMTTRLLTSLERQLELQAGARRSAEERLELLQVWHRWQGVVRSSKAANSGKGTETKNDLLASRVAEVYARRARASTTWRAWSSWRELVRRRSSARSVLDRVSSGRRSESLRRALGMWRSWSAAESARESAQAAAFEASSVATLSRSRRERAAARLGLVVGILALRSRSVKLSGALQQWVLATNDHHGQLLRRADAMAATTEALLAAAQRESSGLAWEPALSLTDGHSQDWKASQVYVVAETLLRCAARADARAQAAALAAWRGLSHRVTGHLLCFLPGGGDPPAAGPMPAAPFRRRARQRSALIMLRSFRKSLSPASGGSRPALAPLPSRAASPTPEDEALEASRRLIADIDRAAARPLTGPPVGRRASAEVALAGSRTRRLRSQFVTRPAEPPQAASPPQSPALGRELWRSPQAPSSAPAIPVRHSRSTSRPSLFGQHR